jgi:hypothetical protein
MSIQTHLLSMLLAGLLALVGGAGLDLKSWEAKPVEGIDVAISGGAQFAVLDGRTFVFLPYEDWSKSKIYELDEDGRAVERATTTGDVFKWVRVR